MFSLKPLLPATFAMLVLAGCSPAADTPATPTEAPAPLVSVITLSASSVTIWDELPARVSAFRTADIRSQVSGLIVKRLFAEGSDIKQGEALFQIDTTSFLADVASAEAAVRKSQAALRQSAIDLERARALQQSRTISEQAFDRIETQEAQSQADLSQAEAALKKARLSLNLATVKAPIDGQIGAATVGEGMLADASSTIGLATIQQIGRVHIDIRQPASRLEHLRTMMRSGGLQQAGAIPIEILPGEGDADTIAAQALFSDISVDEGTGNVRLRAVADNADKRLLPGMYVRTRVPRGTYPDAISVPQQAVIRDLLGVPSVYVVDAQNNAAPRAVQIGELVEGRYLVRNGLKAGDRVVMEGQDKLASPGPVRTIDYAAPTQN